MQDTDGRPEVKVRFAPGVKPVGSTEGLTQTMRTFVASRLRGGQVASTLRMGPLAGTMGGRPMIKRQLTAGTMKGKVGTEPARWLFSTTNRTRVPKAHKMFRSLGNWGQDERANLSASRDNSLSRCQHEGGHRSAALIKCDNPRLRLREFMEGERAELHYSVSCPPADETTSEELGRRRITSFKIDARELARLARAEGIAHGCLDMASALGAGVPLDHKDACIMFNSVVYITDGKYQPSW